MTKRETPLRKLSRLREASICMRGKLHDLSIEALAIERYGELPDLLEKEREASIVANGLREIVAELAELDDQIL